MAGRARGASGGDRGVVSPSEQLEFAQGWLAARYLLGTRGAELALPPGLAAEVAALAVPYQVALQHAERRIRARGLASLVRPLSRSLDARAVFAGEDSSVPTEGAREGETPDPGGRR